MLIAWAGPTCIQRLRVEFPLPVFDGDCVTAGGTVSEITATAGGTVAVCDVWLDRDEGSRCVQGRAWVALPDPG